MFPASNTVPPGQSSDYTSEVNALLPFWSTAADFPQPGGYDEMALTSAEPLPVDSKVAVDSDELVRQETSIVPEHFARPDKVFLKRSKAIDGFEILCSIILLFIIFIGLWSMKWEDCSQPLGSFLVGSFIIICAALSTRWAHALNLESGFHKVPEECANCRWVFDKVVRWFSGAFACFMCVWLFFGLQWFLMTSTKTCNTHIYYASLFIMLFGCCWIAGLLVAIVFGLKYVEAYEDFEINEWDDAEEVDTECEDNDGDVLSSDAEGQDESS